MNMKHHASLSDHDLKRFIRQGRITLAGNRALRIYGLLKCGSGRRMKKENRVFFESTEEAVLNGYRPCAHCLRHAYLEWKLSNNQVDAANGRHEI